MESSVATVGGESAAAEAIDPLLPGGIKEANGIPNGNVPNENGKSHQNGTTNNQLKNIEQNGSAVGMESDSNLCNINPSTNFIDQKPSLACEPTDVALKCDADDSSSPSSDNSQISANSNPRSSLPLSYSSNKKDATRKYPKKSILSQISQSSSSNYKRPPDGGWGWVVVFASFMINLIVDGIPLSFGVLYPYLQKEFLEGSSKTSLAIAILLSIPLLTGPIASAFTDHFGCRKVTIAGSILASFGFGYAYFARHIWELCFAFFVSGLGIALCSVASIVCVAYYFEKRRSLATGLSVCGTGIGTLFMAPLISFLARKYELRNTLLIIAALFLSISIFALLIRDIDLDDDSDEEESSSEEDSSSDIESNIIDSDMNSLADEEFGQENDAKQQSKLSALAGDKSDDDSSKDSSPEGRIKRIHFSKSVRNRHISETEPTMETMPRTCSSLINIPTYIKNASNSRDTAEETTTDASAQNKDSIGELTFRRGGYLHNLITYYPHLLSYYLPWNLECNDLTVKTVPAKTNSDRPSVLPEDAKTSMKADCEAHVQCPEKKLQVEFETPPDSPINRFIDANNIHQDSVAIPVPTPPNFNELITNYKAGGRISSGSRLVRGRHRHRMYHHHLHNDLLPGGHCLHNLRLQRGSLTYRSAMLIISKYKLKASSAPDIYRTSMITINETKGFTFLDNIKEILTDMVDLSTFKNIPYLIFCISNFLLYACIDIPYVYFHDHATTSLASDNPKFSEFSNSIIGVCNTLGVIFIGYIGDKPWLDASMIYAIFIIVSGISVAAAPLATSLTFFFPLTAIFGFSISANYALVSVILVEFISLDAFTRAYGLLLLTQGIGSLIGPPIVGLIYDMYGTYDICFYMTGLCTLISGLMIIFVSKRKNCFLWSYQLSRTGSDTSLTFKPLSFLRNGVYGSTVCSKRNSVSIFREYQDQQQAERAECETMLTVNGETKPIKNGNHHVVIIDDEEDEASGHGRASAAVAAASPEISKDSKEPIANGQNV